MPPTNLVIFREANGSIPLLEWLDKNPDLHTYRGGR